LSAELNRLSTAWFDLKTAASDGPFNNATSNIVRQLAANMDDLASVIRNNSAPAAQFLAKTWTLVELAIKDAAATAAFAVQEFQHMAGAIDLGDLKREMQDFLQIGLDPRPWKKFDAVKDVQDIQQRQLARSKKALAETKNEWATLQDTYRANDQAAQAAFNNIDSATTKSADVSHKASVKRAQDTQAEA